MARLPARLPHAAACDFGSKFTHICITDPIRNMVLCHRIDMQTVARDCDCIRERIDRLVAFVVGNRFVNPILPPSISVLIEKQTPKNPVCFALMYATIASIESANWAKSQFRSHNRIHIIDPKLKFAKLGIVADFKNKSHKLQMTKFVKNYLIEHNIKIQLFDSPATSKIVEPRQLYADDFVKNVKFDDIADCIGMILAHAAD